MKDDGKYVFKLFISGMSVKSSRALENLKKITDEHLQGRHELEIIDIGKDKIKALEFQVFAIPTLLKVSPHPPRTILGDLSEKEKVLKLLDIV
jgi:circadian clock protein KaiB